MSQHAAAPAGGSARSWALTALQAARAVFPSTHHGARVRTPTRRAAVLAPGAALVVATGFVAGAVVGVTTNQISRDASYSAAIAAQAEAEAHVLRVEGAASERLSAQGTAYLAHHRTEALAEAHEAAAEAGALVASVSTVVDTDTLAPLDDALSAIADLVGAAPAAPVVLSSATATVAAALPVAVPEAAPVSPTTPGADVLDLVESARHDGDTAAPAPRSEVTALRPTTASASTPEPTTSTPSATARGASARSATPAPAPSASAPAPGADAPERTPDADAVTSSPGPTGTAAARAVPSPVVTVAPPTLDDVFVLGTSVATPTVPASAVALVSAEGLDRSTSDEILTLATELRTLSTRVQAQADTILAEKKAAAEAKAQAEATAKAAAERAATTLAGRIAAADAAPNGEIPEEVLCSVSFSSGSLLRCDAAAALEAMDAAYRAETGKHLVLTSAYRTAPQQVVLRETKGSLAAVPGTSNHGRGLAVDIAGAGSLGQFTAPLYSWLVANPPPS